jgi:hypothetical protein
MQRASVPVADLFRLWANPSLTRMEVARELGVTYRKLTTLASRHHLPKRDVVAVQDDEGGRPDDWGEPEADDSLDLSPWVQGRIRELGIVGGCRRRDV